MSVFRSRFSRVKRRPAFERRDHDSIHRVFQDHFHLLCDTLDLRSLMAKLYTARVISASEFHEIQEISNEMAIDKLLQCTYRFDVESFHTMLKIMEEHGTPATRNIVLRIKYRLDGYPGGGTLQRRSKSAIVTSHRWRYASLELSNEATWADLVAALRSPGVGLIELAASVERIFIARNATETELPRKLKNLLSQLETEKERRMQVEGMLCTRNAELKQMKIKNVKLKKKMKKEISKIVKYLETIQPSFSAICEQQQNNEDWKLQYEELDRQFKLLSQSHKELEGKYAMAIEHNEVLMTSVSLCRQVIDEKLQTKFSTELSLQDEKSASST